MRTEKPEYRTETVTYEPGKGCQLVGKITNFPAKSEWEAMCGGDQQVASLLRHACLQHLQVRYFKKPREANEATHTLDCWTFQPSRVDDAVKGAKAVSKLSREARLGALVALGLTPEAAEKIIAGQEVGESK